MATSSSNKARIKALEWLNVDWLLADDGKLYAWDTTQTDAMPGWVLVEGWSLLRLADKFKRS